MNNEDIEKQKKAESLAHFSFVKSNNRLLLVDIQGSDYNLTDPEIATASSCMVMMTDSCSVPETYLLKLARSLLWLKGAMWSATYLDLLQNKHHKKILN